MKAVIWTAYGPPDVLKLADIPKPVPGDNEVCIKVYATSVVAGDCEMRSLRLPFVLRLPMRLMNGLRAPKRNRLLGQEFAGVVDAVGGSATRFHAGDAVFGATGFGHGTYAEYICLPAHSEDNVMEKKPDGLTFEQAATVPVGALEALHFLRRGNIQPGESLLINGAGGSIGTMAVQIAKAAGAQVTAVDRAEKLDMLLSIGADGVMDYMRGDFTQSSGQYDVIFDVVGKASFGRCIRALKPGGRYLLSNPTFSKMIRSVATRWFTDKSVVITAGRRSGEDLRHIKELLDTGQLKPVVDKHFALAQMSQAHAYVESGRKQGSVAVTVAGGQE